MTNQTAADTREHLRLLALSLATGSALVEPSAFDAAIDAHRAAVLREAADAVFALDYDVMVGEEGDENMGSMREAWDVGTIHATQLLRRMADETQPAEHQPHRGDRFEAWLKEQRDACFGHATTWGAVDGLLDRYRLHADTRTPLGQHVCEGQVVGDCECLEQSAARARQDGAQPPPPSV
jgi:hypothetical protein